MLLDKIDYIHRINDLKKPEKSVTRNLTIDSKKCYIFNSDN
jgi:hypothetical protein